MHSLAKFGLARRRVSLGPSTATFAYVDTTYSDTIGAETFTFTSHAIGPAASNRYVVVGAVFDILQLGYTGAISCTIAGVSATKLFSTMDVNPDSQIVIFFGASVPTGTTGNIVFNTNDTDDFADIEISVWALYYVNTTPTDTGWALDCDSGGVGTFSIDCPAGGVVLMLVDTAGDGLSMNFTKTGMTQDSLTNLSGAFSGNSETPATLSIVETVSGSIDTGMVIGVAFAPG